MPKPKVGTIHKLPSGKWLARYSAPNGKRIGKTFLTKTDGTAWLQGVYTDISKGAWVSPGDSGTAVTFEDYATTWLKKRKVKGQPIAARTRSGYQDLLDRFIVDDDKGRPAFRGVALHTITREDVERWYDKTAPDRPTYQAKAYSLLRTILGSAVDEGLIPSNPARIRGAGAVDREHDVRPATVEELATLTNAMPEAYRLLVQLAAFCAMRYGELTELRRKDVDTKDGKLRIERAVVLVDGAFIVKTPKTKAGIRRVTIPAHLMPMVRDHLLRFTGPGADGLLFPSVSDATGHLRQTTMFRMFDKARKAAGRPDLRFHDLRHTGAVMAAQAGATLAELMARLGHTTSSAAMRYQHAAEDRDAVIAARISAMFTASAPDGGSATG